MNRKEESKAIRERGQPFFCRAAGGASLFTESSTRLQLAAISSAYREANLHIFQLDPN
jgi:hypothetical protein